jgi:hypothetical protein
MPSGLTFPSKIGQVLGLEAIAMLMGMFMTLPDEAVYRKEHREADTNPGLP